MKIYLIDRTLKPSRGTPSSAGLDLYAREDIDIPSLTSAMIPLNVIVDYKNIKDRVLLIFARSGLFKKTGLIMTNSVGVIDEDYCGPGDEICMSIFNVTKQQAFIKRGTRVAQMLFLKRTDVDEEIEFLAQSDLKDKSSRGGYGSTGE